MDKFRKEMYQILYDQQFDEMMKHSQVDLVDLIIGSKTDGSLNVSEKVLLERLPTKKALVEVFLDFIHPDNPQFDFLGASDIALAVTENPKIWETLHSRVKKTLKSLAKCEAV